MVSKIYLTKVVEFLRKTRSEGKSGWHGGVALRLLVTIKIGRDIKTEKILRYGNLSMSSIGKTWPTKMNHYTWSPRRCIKVPKNRVKENSDLL